jgi:predicted DNA-binding protein (MmcQ/YjbR family)
MARTDPVLAKMREICLALPETKETLTWGEPHFRVGEKIFSGYDKAGGVATIGFKMTVPDAVALVREDPRAKPAPYVGKHGWIAYDATKVDDWDQVRAWVVDSYRLIAPKRLAATLDPAGAATKPKARISARKTRRG